MSDDIILKKKPMNKEGLDKATGGLGNQHNATNSEGYRYCAKEGARRVYVVDR